MTSDLPGPAPAPCRPTAGHWRPTAAHAQALDHLRGAHAALEEADRAARAGLAVGWESPAAERFREGVTALLATLGDDRRVLDEVVAVVGS